MLIQIDTDKLVSVNLATDLYVIIYLLKEQKYKDLSKIIGLYNKSDIPVLLQRLYDTGYVIDKNNPGEDIDYTKISVKESFNELSKSTDYFDEILQVYPTSVIRPDGLRDYLRADITRCRKVYNKLTKNNKELHDTILSSLQYEIMCRRRDNNMSYMKRLSKWLASEEWKVYEQAMKEDKGFNFDDIDLGYGNKLA